MPQISIRGRSYRSILWLALLLVAASGLVALAPGQELPQPRGAVMGGAAPDLTQVKDRDPRPKEASAFLDPKEPLTSNDQFFEVTIGQGRILTLKDDLAVAGKAAPLIAVGDPALIEFVIVNSRQIRVIGWQIGITDLSITTGDRQTYTFEVRVTADLNPLRGQLHRSFPDAVVKLSQLRDHVVVEGQTRDHAQAAKIIEIITAFMDSIAKSQDRKATSAAAPTQPKVEGRKDGEVPATLLGGAGSLRVESKIAQPKIINLLRVPDPLVALQAQLAQTFPEASLRLTRVGAQVAVEGQARDSGQVARIMQTMATNIASIDESQKATTADSRPQKDGTLAAPQMGVNVGGPSGPAAEGMEASKLINRLRVPGPQQVLLKVRVAELNRTALRQVGADFLVASRKNGALFGTNIAGNGRVPKVTGSNTGLVGLAEILGGGPATVFGVFENSDFAFFFNALRHHELLKILAEPNLVALNGHQATFLAGGEFPVPVPQSFSGGGAATITIQFKKFGVSLAFKPDILDGGAIRLAVDPEVSSIDFAIGTSINGTVVPGLNTRNAHTVVEMREGQTLAMAGLLSVTLDGTTTRIPGLGDLPILGPFFSNTTSKRQEKELIVLVTPFLVDALRCEQVPPSPGVDANCPNDLEFYLGNRIEGRSGRDWRSTTGNYASAPAVLPSFLMLHDKYVRGPHGFSD